MDGAVAKYAKEFIHSPLAHNSLLYLETLAHISFPKTHFTTRDILHSYLLLETVSGSGYFSYEDINHDLNPGDILLIDCRKPHHYHASSENGWSYRLAHFNGLAMSNLFTKFYQSRTFFFPATENEKAHSFIDQLFEIASVETVNQELYINCILTELITDLLTRSSQEASALPVWIQEICNYLDNHHQSDILVSLEKEFYRSKYYICHAFKKYMGISILQYQIRSRLQNAETLLLESNLSIEKIAILVGYENINSFDKAFRKYFGITPGSYRKQRIIVSD